MTNRVQMEWLVKEYSLQYILALQLVKAWAICREVEMHYGFSER